MQAVAEVEAVNRSMDRSGDLQRSGSAATLCSHGSGLTLSYPNRPIFVSDPASSVRFATHRAARRVVPASSAEMGLASIVYFCGSEVRNRRAPASNSERLVDIEAGGRFVSGAKGLGRVGSERADEILEKASGVLTGVFGNDDLTSLRGEWD